MGDREERSERIREEVNPQSDDPEVADVEEAAHEGGILGRVDEIAGLGARAFTADSRPRAHEGLDVAPRGAHPLHETGTSETLSLSADAERRLHPGDELVVQLPEDGAGEGWTYDVEGDERSLDISERAELVVRSGQHHHQPASGGCYQFVIHATGRGRAVVRFEPQAAGGERAREVRLRLEIH